MQKKSKIKLYHLNSSYLKSDTILTKAIIKYIIEANV